MLVVTSKLWPQKWQRSLKGSGTQAWELEERWDTRTQQIRMKCISFSSCSSDVVGLSRFVRTCRGRWGALLSWTCLHAWSCSLRWMLRSEPNSPSRTSLTKSKHPALPQNGETTHINIVLLNSTETGEILFADLIQSLFFSFFFFLQFNEYLFHSLWK